MMSKAFLRLQIAWENVPRCKSTILVAGWQWILAVPWLCLLAEPSSSHCLLHCLRCWERSWFCTPKSCASLPLHGVEPNIEPFWKGKGICGRWCKSCQAVLVWPPASGPILFWTNFIIWVFSPEAKEVEKDVAKEIMEFKELSFNVCTQTQFW